MFEPQDQDLQISERGINELKAISNFANDFSQLANLCSSSAHLGGSVAITHIQSLICAYVDVAVSMDELSSHIDFKLEPIKH